MVGIRLLCMMVASGGCWSTLALALWLVPGGNPLNAMEPPGETHFQQQVLPLLANYCGDCHGETTHEDRWTWESAASYSELLEERPAWRKVAQLVSAHIMPPHDSEPLSLPQRHQLLDWIETVVFHVDPARPDPGPVTLRRLNRAEYNATIRDVLGLDHRPADQFPEDDSGYGFDNIADVLTVSPLHVEKYLAAASDISGELTRLENPPRVGIELTGIRLTTFAGESELHDQQVALPNPSVEVGTVVDVPVTSLYRVLTRAAVSRRSDERLATLEVLSNGQVIAELRPTSQWQGRPGGTSTVFTLVELTAGEHQLALRVKREPKDETSDSSKTSDGSDASDSSDSSDLSDESRASDAAEELGASIQPFVGEL